MRHQIFRQMKQKAAAKGITPKEYVDEIVKTFKALWEKMHVSYDRYIRTPMTTT